MTQRRDNLNRSIGDLKRQLAPTKSRSNDLWVHGPAPPRAGEGRDNPASRPLRTVTHLDLLWICGNEMEQVEIDTATDDSIHAFQCDNGHQREFQSTKSTRRRPK